MAKEAVFTLTLDPDLQAAFMAEAASDDRPASQVMRELMRDYVDRRRQARDYDDYVAGKVAAARASMRAGTGRANDDVEADFAARRAEAAAQR